MGLSVAPNAALSAIAGIRAASSRLDKAAAKVAAASIPQEDTVSISDGARAAAAGGDTTTHDVASAMIDLRVAKYQNATSIAVLRTTDDVTRDALKIGEPESRR